MTDREVDDFVSSWTSTWLALDIDAATDHFATDGETRSPLATRVVGTSLIREREAMRQYWREAYAGVGGPGLVVEASSWDDRPRRLTVWRRAAPRGVATRACEHTDFGPDGSIRRSEACHGSAD